MTPFRTVMLTSLAMLLAACVTGSQTMTQEAVPSPSLHPVSSTVQGHSKDQPADSIQPPSVSSTAAPIVAASLHEAMHSALRVAHDRYYREDEGLIIPAAALREVFEDIQKKRNIQLRWLVVEGEAMNVDHEAQDDFEKAAVKALIAGREFYEESTDKLYRRAAPITLSNHCLKCHVPNRRSTRDRRAGLIVSIPLRAK